MKLVKIGLVATVLAAVVAFVGVGRPDFARGSAASGRTVTVTGTGSVESVPNRAGFSVGVSSDGSTARAALAANADKASNVIEALRAAGVAKADLQTTDVTVSPRWDDRGRQDGFTAHSSVQVDVASVSRAGAILDAAVAAGATETSGPSFDRSDRSELYRNALKAAFADARGKAATLAGEAGASVGAVRRIEESPGLQPMPLFAARAAGDSATPIEPGTTEVQATVTVTFSLS
ncbi:MAG TPA: SIMPL domain-containing protein [Gaiellaceae bacterium]|jgi:hypothetical protein|nr:SIMPL domain-containing protein [Gaiellaceae bacterium]